MASLRKAGAYSKKYARPNTRTSKKRSKAFIKTTPPIKVVKFNVGRRDKFDEGKLNIEFRVISLEKIQIRDNALEATRQFINRKLENEIPGNFYFEIRVFPHHILRENKMITGAGADRMQSGMKHAFGKTSGRAAMVKQGGELFLIATSGEKSMKIVKSTLNSIKAKLPCKTKLLIKRTSKPTL